jgi:hypothetical protein
MKAGGVVWDRVAVINLDHRTDRMEQFRKGVRGSEMLSSVAIQRFPACNPRTVARPGWFQSGHNRNPDPFWACRESHLRLWQQAILDNVQHLLVFEDDAGIWRDFDERFQRFFRELPANWLGYQLGGFWWGGGVPVSPHCQRMTGCGGLHAYALNAAGLRRAYDHVMWHRTEWLDVATASLHAEEPHFYAPERFFVSQLPGYSDNFGGVPASTGTEQEPAS